MFDYQAIKMVHLEPSSFCNARCPLCPRNDYGVPNENLIERNLSLDDCRQIFPEDFLSRIEVLLFEGNFGDPIMNSDLIDIINWVKAVNPKVFIEVTTNGGARNREFWQELAKCDITVRFSIDGLEDTNHLYRQDVNWSAIMKNVNAYISHGGNAIWKFIKFDHNQHQIETARDMAMELGFQSFVVEDHGRNLGPVFDRDGNYTHSIGDWKDTRDFEKLKKRRWPIHEILVPEDFSMSEHKNINCRALQPVSIYISSQGNVYPCCWVGFATLEYGIQKKDFSYQQIAKIMKNNNAIKNDLSTCMEWFKDISQSWKKNSYQQGRLMTCQTMCQAD